MTQKRTHFFIPEELLAEMDKVAGKGNATILSWKSSTMKSNVAG